MEIVNLSTFQAVSSVDELPSGTMYMCILSRHENGNPRIWETKTHYVQEALEALSADTNA